MEQESFESVEIELELAVENFDKLVVGTILDKFKKTKQDFRVMVLPDHATPLEVRTHTRDPIPFAIYGSGIAKDSIKTYNETAASSSELSVDGGHNLLPLLLK